MTRFLPALLASALAASAQDTTAPARILRVDAVVTDASGRPVTNLLPADFEITEDGKARSVVRLTAFDTVRHTAATIGELPALELTPDQIRRTLAIVVDDLCLLPEGIKETRGRIRRLIETQLVPGDRVSILRTSSGNGRAQQFSGEQGQIALALAGIQYLGGALSRQSCASAAWSTVSYALNGLSAMEGRKTVVLMSDDLPAPSGVAAREIGRMAARSATALYMVAATAPTLAAETGGAAGVDLDRAFEEQRSFYVLGVAAGSSGNLMVKLRRPDLVLRSRTSAIGQPARVEVPSPPTPAELIRQVMNSPFEGAAVGMRLTALFSSSPEGGAVVEGLMHIDARDLSYLRGADGKYHIEFEVYLSSALDSGQLAPASTRAHAVELTAEEYRRVMEEGLVYVFPLNAWTAGARQVRAALMDGRSGRAGSASAFVEVHDLLSGEFFLSGIALQGASSSTKETPAVREFPAGKPLSFVYSVYNAAVREDGRSEVETQVRIFAEGREMYTGRSIPLMFEAGPKARPRQVNGRIQLDSRIGPGRYVLQVNVIDKVHAKARSASQFMDFTIEP